VTDLQSRLAQLSRDDLTRLLLTHAERLLTGSEASHWTNRAAASQIRSMSWFRAVSSSATCRRRWSSARMKAIRDSARIRRCVPTSR